MSSTIEANPPRTVEPSSSTPATAPQDKRGEDDQLSLASTVEDTETPETPARLTSPFVVDIRYNREKKSWADLDEEDDDEWMGTSMATLDIHNNPEKKSWADLDEDAAATAATPEDNPALGTAGLEYGGYRPCSHKESWLEPELDTIFEEEDEGPVDVGCFPRKRSCAFPRTTKTATRSKRRITGRRS
ncbi:hypothetical protein B0T18DRAFT_488451 [Schizothecium vesticola]|uniref:Uncharacterized protein n=1 Tax=Schizothecium vesticola TaxID=314040 RepID=A0AA40K4L0_9PEZI|nr:hypothetical protein B0T18DRAFT_488451 [Schizothecium vesticola]